VPEPVTSEAVTLPAIQYLVGAVKETTAAVEEYYEVASLAQLFVERITNTQLQMIALPPAEVVRTPDAEASDELPENGGTELDGME
jgi:hypothetical protein